MNNQTTLLIISVIDENDEPLSIDNSLYLLITKYFQSNDFLNLVKEKEIEDQLIWKEIEDEIDNKLQDFNFVCTAKIYDIILKDNQIIFMIKLYGSLNKGIHHNQ